MLDLLNNAWPRRSLGWRTARDVWRERPPITPAERLALRDDDRTPTGSCSCAASPWTWPSAPPSSRRSHPAASGTARWGGWCYLGAIYKWFRHPRSFINPGAACDAAHEMIPYSRPRAPDL
jgi:hypothetical protein